MRRNRHLSDLESDIQNHIEIETQDNIARGMSPEEARYAAMRKFGNVTRAMEDTREVWAIAWLDNLIQDLRFAIRGIRKSPLFATVVVLTLALGIGANTAIFTIIDSVMLRAIPVSNPQQLVVFSWKALRQPDYSGHSSFGDCKPRGGHDCALSVPYFQALQAHASDVFSGVAAFSGPITVDFSGTGGKATAARGTYISGDFFNTLGVSMALGRPIGLTDDTPSAAPVIVLDYNYWRRVFGSDPSVVGRSVRLNNTSVMIAGVASQNFTNFTPGKTQDFYMPMSLVLQVRSQWWETGGRLFEPASFWIVVIGRLKPGVLLAQAQTEAAAIFRNDSIYGAKPIFKEADDPKVELSPLGKELTGESGQIAPMLYLMMVAVGIVLLIACANVAGLMLARSARRQKEMALRIAIGAGRGRIVRQLLTESVLFATCGGALGVMLAVWAVKAITHFMGSAFDNEFPYVIEPNGRVLAFTVIATFITGILFGLAPARRCASVDVNPSLKESASSQSKGSANRWLRLGDVLVVAQVALSILVAVGAGLLVRSLQNLHDIDPGFATSNLLLFEINPSLMGYNSAQTDHLYRDLQERLAVLPGVSSVSYSGVALLSGSLSGTDVHNDVDPPGKNINVDVLAVGLNFLSTMKIPLISGRTLEARDFSSAALTHQANRDAKLAAEAEAKKRSVPATSLKYPPVTAAPIPILINRAFAAKFFPKQDAVGKHVGFSDYQPDPGGLRSGYSVIGVIGDTRYETVKKEPEPTMYEPLLSNTADYELRTEVDPETLIPAMRQIVSEEDNNLPVTGVSTQTEQIDRVLFQERLTARVSSIFGVLTLGLACFGLYGLLSYEVAWRTRELGIRMALGAQPRDILRLVVRQVIAIVAIGLAVGIAAALGLTRFMSELLYNVRPNDPATIAGVAALLAVVALVACYLPARRAIHTDPIIALRHE
jgi:predicted permease